MGEGMPSLHGPFDVGVAPTSDLAAWAGGVRQDGVVFTADEPSYRSADTAPRGFAVHRAWWVAPLFLLFFAGASAALAWQATALTDGYARVLSTLTGADAGFLAGSGASIAIRPFVIVLLTLLAVFSSGSVQAKMRFVLTSWAAYVSVTLLVDIGFAVARPLGAPSPLSPIGGIVALLVALVAGVCLVFTQYELPDGVRVATERRRATPPVLVLAGAIALATAAAVVLHEATGRLQPGTAHTAAALASTTAILVIGTQLLLYVFAVSRRRPDPGPGYAPTVAFLIPAHNERDSIGATIAAIDAAAQRHPGPCRLYFVDNASTDGTAEAAADALRHCVALTGRVLSCKTRGKAHALNHGLAQTTEDIVVRVDSDTIVKPTLLSDVTPYFADESIGGVSGVPLPRPGASRWLSPLWLMEVYHTIGFVRVAQNAIDGAIVLPGSMSVYRGEVVRRLGGFAVGHNGEDGDMAVRIGRLGYRLVTDPRVEFFTEVPASLGHLMEQRLRWYRGGFYKAARNKSSFVLHQGLRGLVVLPWAAFSSCRRAFSVPVLIAIGAATVVNPAVFTLQDVAVAGGAALGANLVLVGVLLLVKGRPLALLFLPAYLAFRVFKLYVAFVALLTLELRRTGDETETGSAGWVEWALEGAPA